MSDEEIQMLLIRGHIAGLAPEERDRVHERAAKLRELCGINEKDPVGAMALALVGSEMAAAA